MDLAKVPRVHSPGKASAPAMQSLAVQREGTPCNDPAPLEKGISKLCSLAPLKAPAH